MEQIGQFGGILGSFVDAFGTIQQGQADHAASRHTARRIEQAARVEQQQAGQREDAIRRSGREVLGRQRAAFAQSGGGMGGSAADVMRQSGANVEMDALIARYEGNLRAQGMHAAANAERFAGRQAVKSSYYAATGKVLGGTGDYLAGT